MKRNRVRIGKELCRIKRDGSIVPRRGDSHRMEWERKNHELCDEYRGDRRVESNLRLTEKSSLVRREREYRMYIDYCHGDMTDLSIKELSVKWCCTEDEIRGVVSRISSARTVQLARLADGLRLMKCEEFLGDGAMVREELDKQMGELPESGRVEVEYMDGAGKDGGGISRCQPVNRIKLGLLKEVIQLRKDEQEGLTGYLGKPVQKVEMDVKDQTLRKSYENIDAEIMELENRKVSAEGRVNVMSGGIQ